MANRMISYGYGIVNGCFTVIPSEAKIVRRIFAEYGGGKKLQEIAETLTSQKIVFFNGSSEWNKNKVCRIIENKKYIGEDNYPPIISIEDFDKAVNLKNSKGAKEKECSEDIEYLKNRVFCSQCGKPLRRIYKWKTREKWICTNGCKCDKYIDDSALFVGISRIIDKIKRNGVSIFENTDLQTYQRTTEIMRFTNEIGRITNERNPSFSAGKKAVMECAALKFNACKENRAEIYSQFIVDETEKLDDNPIGGYAFWKKVFNKITINQEGVITIRLINDVEVDDKIEKEETNATASTGEKDCNEN